MEITEGLRTLFLQRKKKENYQQDYQAQKAKEINRI